MVRLAPASCAVIFAAVVAACSLAGCGGPERAPLKGQVLYKDKPLTFGLVLMQPVAGGQFARGEIQSDGSFEMGIDSPGDGARIGENLIAVRVYQSQGPTDATKGEIGLGKPLIPDRYAYFGTSQLTVAVKPEQNEPLILKLTD